MTRRDEKVDVRALLRGDDVGANGTDAAVREADRQRIWAYWPAEFLDAVRDGRISVSLRFLRDPTGWRDVSPAEVFAYVESVLPGRLEIDALHERFGRKTNHEGERSAAPDTVGQMVLS